MTIGKGRESESGLTMGYHWDFYSMNFAPTGIVVNTDDGVDENNPFGK